MAVNQTPVAFNPFATVLKALGSLANPETKQGKAFKTAESKATRVFTRLAANNFYLNFAGRSMELAFLMRSQFNLNTEMWLKLWRLPTTSDIDDLREQIYGLNGTVDAMSHQLEYLLDHLQAINAGIAKGTSVEGSKDLGSKDTVKEATVVPMTRGRGKASEGSAEKREEA